MIANMRIGFCGLGLIGTQRFDGIRALQATETEHRLEILGCFDPANHWQRARPDLSEYSLPSFDLLLSAGPDLVFVSTPHDAVIDICTKLLQNGVRVHVEKPLGRTLLETNHLCALDPTGGLLTVGFNYRFFRGVECLLRDISDGIFGDIISIEMLIGHGGDPTNKSSWKMNPKLAGGGSLLDPGIHLVDLCLQIEPRLQLEYARSWSGFWKTGIEEEVIVVFTSMTVPSITLKSSLVHWRSEFSLRVNGTNGYGVVQGRGRSYGVQTYRRGKRWGWKQAKSQADSEELICTDDGTDSFLREMRQLVSPSRNLPKVGTADDAREVMKIIETIYANIEETSRKTLPR